MRSILRRVFLGRFSGVAATAPLLAFRRATGAQRGAVSGIDHVAAPMRNVEAMVRFYRALGLRVDEGSRICSVHCGDHKINFHRPELWRNGAFALRAPAAAPPCLDLCFVWEGALEALVEKLRNVGAEVIEGPVERQGGRDGGKASGISHYVRDPDGNLIEFIRY